MRTCENCKQEGLYYAPWDAHCCLTCNVWIEPICASYDCPFECKKRPDKPLVNPLKELQEEMKIRNLRKREWIKVADERPPFMEMVIFYDGENVWPGWDESQASEEMSAVCADPGFRDVAEDPTHWMLLPEFPED